MTSGSIRDGIRPPGSVVKRAIDFAAAVLVLVLLGPLLLLIALAIVIDSGWPPLFRQYRIGLRGRQFRICKFRTMVVGAEHIGAGLWIERGDPRFTRMGTLLRKTSLDELPQFWNVLLGDMSLVGPRPLLPVTVAELTPEQNLRHRVRPGVTGWAVLHGRNNLPYSRRFKLDNWYIDHWSIRLDIRILLMTVPIVLGGSGTMESLPGDIDDLGPERRPCNSGGVPAD